MGFALSAGDRAGRGALTAALALAAVALAVVPSSGRPAPSFREQFGAVYRQLSATKRGKGWDPEKDRPLIGRLQQLTTTEILRRLNASPAVSATALAAGLNRDIAEAIGGMPIQKLRRYWPDLDFVDALCVRSEKSVLYVVAFYVPDGNSMSRVLVGGFVGGPRGYSLAAQTGGELDDHTVRLLKLSAFRGGHLRFLAYGLRLGSSHHLFEGTEYDFDGGSFRSLWTQPDIAEGQVRLRRGLMVLTYQDIRRWREMRPPYFVRREYLQTRGGLRLVSAGRVNAP